MRDYIICPCESQKYDSFLLCLTFESIINYLKQVETDPHILESSGTLLIDQLLVTGNNPNRFISCHYSFGKIFLSSSEIVTPSIEELNQALKLLSNNYTLIENSILTDQQRDYIKKGIPF